MSIWRRQVRSVVSFVFDHSDTRFNVLNRSKFFRKMSTFSRGAFVVLEGCDRCGKTTQANLLVNNLKQKGHKVEYMRFPDRSTRVGSLISDYLRNEEQLEDHVIHLLFAANRWEFRDTMLNLIKNGTTLIVDRYSFSGVAFSATKTNMDIEWCKQPEVGLPAPDAVLFMELDPDIASLRGQFGDERYEDLNTQQQVREVYQKLQQANWKVMDANKPIGQLQMEILENVENIIKSVGESPLRALWN